MYRGPFDYEDNDTDANEWWKTEEDQDDKPWYDRVENY